MDKKRGFDVLRFIKILAATVGLLMSTIFLLFVAMIFLTFASVFLSSDTKISLDGKNVAIIPLHGEISTSGSADYFQSTGVQSQKIIDWIKEAEEDSKIKAIVFDIDSPGGTPVGSAEIADAIKKTEKPTAALIHEMGASGAYWVASAADVIFANRMSSVGSIGVRGSYIEYAGIMDDYNVTYRRLVAGKYKDITTPYKQMTPEELALVQTKLDRLHDIFINEVAENRNISAAKIREIATGYVYLGYEAKELGLVDVIGGKDEVKDYFEKMLNITVSFREYQSKKSLFESLSKTMTESAYIAGQGMGSVLLGSTKDNQAEFTV